MSAQNDEGCADYLERIIYLLDNELDETDCSVVRQHLEECGPCLHKYDLERTVKAVVARSCSEPRRTRSGSGCCSRSARSTSRSPSTDPTRRGRFARNVVT